MNDEKILSINRKSFITVLIILFSFMTLSYVLTFFINKGYDTLVINPIYSKNNTRNLRLTKTDKQDCYNLADLFFKQNIKNNNSSINDLYNDLNAMSREYNFLVDNRSDLKNRFKQLLNLTFPEAENIFKGRSLFEQRTLDFLNQFPHPDLLKNKRVDAIAHSLSKNSRLTYKNYMEKAKKIKEMSKISFPGVTLDSLDIVSLKGQIKLLKFHNDLIEKHKEKMIALAKQSFLFPIINSIDGIGELTTSLLIAELRDVTRFKNVKQLNAFCGLDPTIIQSGKTINYHGPISKRGNKHVRKILYNCCTNIIITSSRNDLNNPILVYFRKKQDEGKHHYESIVACSTKLLRIIYSMANNNTHFIVK